jgi:sortase (surface protein transpeptidase)
MTIPELGVTTEVESLSLDKRGELEVPDGGYPAGWYDGSPTPGETGPSVVAGHVRYGKERGVFEKIHTLRPGSTIEVTRKDGNVAVFKVTKTETYDKDHFPTDAVYGNVDHAGLRLITCDGLDPKTNKFEDNTVVYAELASSVIR